jgi:hypothetical protein
MDEPHGSYKIFLLIQVALSKESWNYSINFLRDYCSSIMQTRILIIVLTWPNDKTLFIIRINQPFH